MGGSLQGRLYPRSDDERQKAIEAGYDVDALLFQDDLCKGEQVRGVIDCCECLLGSCAAQPSKSRALASFRSQRHAQILFKTAVWHKL